jgi:hypothetical protein
VRLIKRLDLDEDRWNTCVLNSPAFRHYALTYFLDASSDNWQGLIGENYKWVWPLPIKRTIVNKVYQPLLAQQLGPFGEDMRKEEFVECLNFIQKKYWGYNIKFNESVSQSWINDSQQHINVELDLKDSFQTMEANFNRNVRSNLKKAESSNVQISRESFVTKDVISMFQHGRGSEIRILDDRFYINVESIYNSFAKRNEAETWVARIDGEMVAGLMLLNTNERLLNFFTGSDLLSRRTGAMHLLIASIIREYCNGKYVLDFEGSNNEKLAYFYKSFGGDERVYLQAHQKWNLPI